MEQLVRAAEAGDDVAGLNGVDRAMLYRVTSTMARRAGECASLTPESFIREENGVTLRVAAAYSKHRREDKLPVPTALWAVLKLWMKKKPAGESLWPGNWHEDAAAMLRVDLEAADIPYQADDGIRQLRLAHAGSTSGRWRPGICCRQHRMPLYKYRRDPAAVTRLILAN